MSDFLIGAAFFAGPLLLGIPLVLVLRRVAPRKSRLVRAATALVAVSWLFWMWSVGGVDLVKRETGHCIWPGMDTGGGLGDKYCDLPPY